MVVASALAAAVAVAVVVSLEEAFVITMTSVSNMWASPTNELGC